MPEPTFFPSSMGVQLVDSMGTEASIVQAARVSTLGADARGAESSAGLIKHLYKAGHGSPFEHTSLTFYFDVPICISRQLVKHRLLSTNETSGRYRELENRFYVPSPERKVVQVGKTSAYAFEGGDGSQKGEVTHAITEASKAAWASYEHLLSKGIAKEVARMVLPVNTYTQLFMTGNLRAWLNFIQLRVDWGEGAAKRSHAQYEIEQVGKQVAHVIETLYPTVFESFVAAGYTAV